MERGCQQIAAATHLTQFDRVQFSRPSSYGSGGPPPSRPIRFRSRARQPASPSPHAARVATPPSFGGCSVSLQRRRKRRCFWRTEGTVVEQESSPPASSLRAYQFIPTPPRQLHMSPLPHRKERRCIREERHCFESKKARLSLRAHSWIRSMLAWFATSTDAATAGSANCCSGEGRRKSAASVLSAIELLTCGVGPVNVEGDLPDTCTPAGGTNKSAHAHAETCHGCCVDVRCPGGRGGAVVRPLYQHTSLHTRGENMDWQGCFKGLACWSGAGTHRGRGVHRCGRSRRRSTAGRCRTARTGPVLREESHWFSEPERSSPFLAGLPAAPPP